MNKNGQYRTNKSDFYSELYKEKHEREKLQLFQSYET